MPLELVNMVINEDADDKAALKTYALVSKSCLAQSRKYFFRSVEFVTFDDDPKSRRILANFHSILSQNPTIAPYIREVLVRDLSGEYDPPEDQRPSWIRDEPTFLQTLQVLSISGLKRFTFEVDLYWGSFPIGLKTGLMDVFMAPRLKYLCLRGLRGIYKSCCPAFRNVRDLYLVCVDFDEDEDEDIPMTEVDGEVNISWLGLEEVSHSSDLRI